MSEYICSCNHSIEDHGVVGCRKSHCQCSFPKTDLLIVSNQRRAESELSALRARVAELEQENSQLAFDLREYKLNIKLMREHNVKQHARIAELEAAQATLTPRKCGTCTKLAEQMREAAAVAVDDYPIDDDCEHFSDVLNRDLAIIDIILALPLPTCGDCNPLAPSKPVDDRQVCGNCKHFERCKSLFGCSAGNTECDFSPSKFDPE